jgi:hypothetical protein
VGLTEIIRYYFDNIINLKYKTMPHTINRDEVYNSLIQIYNDESHYDITDRLDLIEYIMENDNRELSFLINQDLVELEDMKETLQK